MPDVHSILLIDKPKGWSSFDVIRYLRKKLNMKKIGHAGTLDPLATGLLIIATGKETKSIPRFMDLAKEYEVEIEFGKISDSYDAEGEVTVFPNTAKKLSTMTRAVFEKNLTQFIGDIQQLPPIFSAIKINGIRAYKLARAGEEVQLKPRNVHITAIDIISWQWPIVRLRVACSKGTYIRSLAHDIGQALGVGGYVTALRRTKIGGFDVEKADKITEPLRLPKTKQ